MTTILQYPEVHVSTNNAVTIPAGQTTSNSIDCGGTTLTGLFFDAAYTTGNISYQVSEDGSNFLPYYDQDGSVIATIVHGPSTASRVPPTLFPGMRWLKLVSTATQTNATVITLALRPV